MAGGHQQKITLRKIACICDRRYYYFLQDCKSLRRTQVRSSQTISKTHGILDDQGIPEGFGDPLHISRNESFERDRNKEAWGKYCSAYF